MWSNQELLLRGIHVHFFTGGQPSGPTLVGLHGLASDARQWQEMTSPFAHTHRLVLLDFPGFGNSNMPTEFSYSYEHLANVVLDLISTLQLGRVTLLGHSMGAAVALVIAADHPEFTERCVLIAPPCYARKMHWTERFATFPIVGSTLFRSLLGSSIFRRHAGSHSYTASLKFSDPTFLMLKQSFKPHGIEARLPRVRAPCLVLWGHEDQVAPWLHGTRIARELAHSRLEILNCGHHPELERPAEVVTLIRQFLEAKR